MRGESTKALAAYQSARRAFLGLLTGLVCVLLIFGSTLNDELRHEQIESFGLALILVGIGGRLWSILYIGGRKSAELVSTGPYSVMRNPLYFFSTIAAAGVGAQTGSITIAMLAAAICASVFYIVALREERFLKATLGTPYEEYVARVPRLIPNPWLFKDQAEITFRPRIFNQTLIDGLAFLAAIPFFELIEEGQELGLIPVLFWLY